MENRVDEFILEVDEDLKREKFESLARQYGPYVAAVVAAVILTISGVVFWNYSANKSHLASSDLYMKAMAINAQESPAQAAEAFALVEDNNGSYTTLAKFERAQILASNEETRDEGLALYRDMMVGKGIDRRYRYLALIYFVQATLDTEDPEILMNLLQEGTVGLNMWPHTTSELTALVALRMGDTQQAKSILESLLESNAPRALVQRASALLGTLKQEAPDA